LLVEKRMSAPCKLLPCPCVVWVATYQDYVTERGKTYPKIVRFKNRKLHYAVSTRVREMRVQE
jgi:hypothetical protein